MKHSQALIQAQLMIQDTPVQLFGLCASSVLPFDEKTWSNSHSIFQSNPHRPGDNKMQLYNNCKYCLKAGFQSQNPVKNPDVFLCW